MATPEPSRSFLVDLADFYAQRQQPHRAMAILEPLEAEGALDLGPSLWLARLMLATGKREEGAALVDRILAEWPSAGRAWYLKGKVAESGDGWAAALDDYRRAVDLAPHDPEVRLAMVRAMLLAWDADLRARGDGADRAAKIEEFEQQVMAASTLVPEADTEGQLMLGYAFRSLRELERAAWRFELAAENPDLRLTALVQRSICLDELGQVAQARQVLETLRREYPEDPEVANSLGYFLAEKDQDLELAEDLIAEALRAEPDNGAFLDSMGWVLYRQGRLEGALDYMIQAVNVLPDDPVILEHLGMVLLGLGQDAEALDTLRRALAVGGDPEHLGPVIETIEKRRAADDP
jgi:tetratricopeptide (TPR) repeat protein